MPCVMRCGWDRTLLTCNGVNNKGCASLGLDLLAPSLNQKSTYAWGVV